MSRVSSALRFVTGLALSFQLASAGPVASSSDLAARQQIIYLDPSPPVAWSANGPFNSLIDGPVWPGMAVDGCEDFAIYGPFDSIRIRMGENTVRGIDAKSIAQNTTVILAGAKEGVNGYEVPNEEYVLDGSERITNFAFGASSGDNRVRTIAFDTSLGNRYSAMANQVRKGELSDLFFTSVPTGSGILARIRGTTCSTGELGSIGFDFLDELESVEVNKIDYEGFSNNILPADAGTPMTVGSMVFDNRNTSVEQRMTMMTTEAVTRAREISLQGSVMIGMTYTVGGNVGIPLVAEGTVSLSAMWTLTATGIRTTRDEVQTTRSGTFWLSCAARKYCTANAFYTQFVLTVNMEATFIATTKNRYEYQWMQKGTYNTAQSIAMQFNITETDSSGGAPVSRVTSGSPANDLTGTGKIPGGGLKGAAER